MSFDNDSLQKVFVFLVKLGKPEFFEESKTKMLGMSNYLKCMIEEYIRTKALNREYKDALMTICDELVERKVLEKDSELYRELGQQIRILLTRMELRSQEKTL